ncbi:trace amine-associated receptor 13c-like [Colossoma macropomum]|uniref:trace amine-associated receptor 13c-like n=1 Tax=Colossoma macropomum TaxID=42526 RepID=UPI0018653BCC|nr:trace amine-associated receptor 13c-like [Colossoma macropomum]
MNYTEYRQNITVQYCFPDNNSSCRKEIYTGPMNIFLLVFLLCISVCTVVLNLLVIISISHFKQLHTPTNLLILSLAVADLLLGLIFMPVKMMRLIDSCWYLGKMACCVLPVINAVLSSASLCSLVFIAADRYIAVCDPLLYSTRVTVCKTSLFIILGWSLSLFYITMCLYFNDHFLPSQISTRCEGECIVIITYYWVIIDLVVSFVVPCSVILILYSVIFNVARRQAKAIRVVKNAAPNKQGIEVSSSSETKAAKKLGTVIFVYLACWIPFYLSSLSTDSLISVSVIYAVFSWLVLINSSVNPLIYAIFYPWFRKSVCYIVTCRIFQSSSSRLNLFPKQTPR